MASLSHPSDLRKVSDAHSTQNGSVPSDTSATEAPQEYAHDVVARTDAHGNVNLLDASNEVDKRISVTSKPAKGKDALKQLSPATVPADQPHLRPPQAPGISASDTVSSRRLTWREWAIQYRTFLESAVKAIALFLFSLAILALLLQALLPPIDAKDRDAVKIPKNFDELQRCVRLRWVVELLDKEGLTVASRGSF